MLSSDPGAAVDDKALCCVLRLQGYRGAQVAWLVVDSEFELTAHTKPRGYSNDASQGEGHDQEDQIMPHAHMASSNHVRSGANHHVVLAIYAPLREMVAMYSIPYGSCLCTYPASKNCQLVHVAVAPPVCEIDASDGHEISNCTLSYILDADSGRMTDLRLVFSAAVRKAHGS